jgi:HSP20 family molecular chaperone IbpA
MLPSRLEMMRDHVRAIHRAVTGQDPPEVEAAEEGPTEANGQSVASRFAELEALARSIPLIAERVPPFSFSPPLDVIGTERELIFELGVPGIDKADVDVDVTDDNTLIVTGARSTHAALDGRIYFHAEMPRGPFRRQVRLPEPTSGAPRVEVDNGVIRIRLSKTIKSQRPRA